MSRVTRPQMPGVAFHITARTQGKAPLFEERLRSTIERHIKEGVASSDAMLFAHVVMPNHFHIVLRQGTRPLGWIMQPIMRRTALLVQHAHNMTGHVFERRYRSHACENADHLRRAIIYTHLNPRRADLCTDLEAYRWSSASLYAPTVGSVEICDVAIALALKLFRRESSETMDRLRATYQEYLEWRIEKDRHDAEGSLCLTPEPVMPAGDLHFVRSFCALPGTSRRASKDLRDKAIELLGTITCELDIEVLRRSNLPHQLVAVRRELIAGLLQAGYRGRDVANFLRTSDSTVSRIAIGMRYAPIKVH